MILEIFNEEKTDDRESKITAVFYSQLQNLDIISGADLV